VSGCISPFANAHAVSLIEAKVSSEPGKIQRIASNTRGPTTALHPVLVCDAVVTEESYGVVALHRILKYLANLSNPGDPANDDNSR